MEKKFDPFDQKSPKKGGEKQQADFTALIQSQPFLNFLNNIDLETVDLNNTSQLTYLEGQFKCFQKEEQLKDLYNEKGMTIDYFDQSCPENA